MRRMIVLRIRTRSSGGGEVTFASVAVPRPSAGSRPLRSWNTSTARIATKSASVAPTTTRARGGGCLVIAALALAAFVPAPVVAGLVLVAAPAAAGTGGQRCRAPDGRLRDRRRR